MPSICQIKHIFPNVFQCLFFLCCSMLSVLPNNLLHWSLAIIFVLLWDISCLEWKFQAALKTFLKNFALVFLCMFSVFMTSKGLLSLESFPTFFSQSKLLLQNFSSFLLVGFLNNRPHWSKGSIFILPLVSELYSSRKE